MADLRVLLEELAERGTPLGPDVVYARARRLADSTGVAPDHRSSVHQPRPRRRVPTLVAAASVVVVLACGVVLPSVLGRSNPAAPERAPAVTADGPEYPGLVAHPVPDPIPINPWGFDLAVLVQLMQ